jgi:hypothetical protein
MSASIGTPNELLLDCRNCGHGYHPVTLVDTAAGPRTHVGETCFGCPACRSRFSGEPIARVHPEPDWA